LSTERDTERVVRSWLRRDEYESADRVLADVLVLLDTTPQRRSWWPARRYVGMSNVYKLVIAAAAVVMVSVVGINLLPAGSWLGVGGPVVTPSPPPSSTPRPSLAPADAFPAAGELEIGRHSITRDGVPFSITVPTSGWTSNGTFGIDKSVGVTPDGASFIFWTETPTGVFTDPCAQVKGPQLDDATDLAAAVASVPGTDLVSGPSDVTVGGYAAKHVAIVVREDAPCSPQAFHLWYATGLARYATELGQEIRVWIVDVDGTLVWIDAETFKDARPEPELEIQQIIDSIRFE
jgi:hypothetical protein